MAYLNLGLFSCYNPIEIDDSILERLYGSKPVVIFKKKSFITYEHQRIEQVIVVREGRVKTSSNTARGHENLYEILYAPSVFGFQALYADEFEFSYPLLTAITDVKASFYTLHEFQEIVDREHELMKCFFKYMRSSLTTARRQAGWACRLSSFEKTVLILILTTYSYKDEEGYFSLTHDDLACFAGTTRSKVTQSLNRLSEMGLIKTKYGKMKIIDGKKLHELAKKIEDQL